MADVPTFAVVPTFGRPCFEQCMKSVIPQVTHTYVIATAHFDFTPGDYVDVLPDLREPKNISRWWNRGIDAAQHHARLIGASAWNVLVVNDDVIACPHLVRTLSAALRLGMIDGYPPEEIEDQRPVLAYPDNFAGDRYAFHTAPGAVDLTTRISGWCFMIKGESGLKADEDLQWWYGDDMLDWTARTMGGALMVPGCAVEHLFPGETTSRDAALTARTHIDRQIFERKWEGRTPH